MTFFLPSTAPLFLLPSSRQTSSNGGSGGSSLLAELEGKVAEK